MTKVLGLVLTKDDRSRVVEFSDSSMMFQLEKEKGRVLEQDWFESDSHAEFQLLFDAETRQLKQKIEGRSLAWADVLSTGRGVELSADGDVMMCPNCRKWDTLPAQEKGGKYKPKSCAQCGASYSKEQALKQERIILPEPGKTGQWYPFVSGEGVNRYHHVPRLWIETEHSGINYKEQATYDGEKLLVRKTGLGIMATISKDWLYFPQVVYYWKKKPQLPRDLGRYSLEYFLAVISSRLLLWWFYHKTGVTEWKSFPYVTQELIQQFPIKKIDWRSKEMASLHDEITELAKLALNANSPIASDLDWKIEDCVMRLYQITSEERIRIQEFFRSVHQMRIVRELYPEFGQPAGNGNNPASTEKPPET